MYKNQLQELAQRSCFNLPSYTCIREGPDHAPRFRSAVNFNGELFESPGFFTTLRQAEHAAAEAALHALSRRGPSHSLAARILDETGVYKNLLQEISQRVGAPLPSYTTVRSGLGHLPVFTCAVELAGIEFTGEPAKNKKQAEKNAAMAAWSSLKQLAKEAASSTSEPENNDEQEQITIARALLNYRLKEKIAFANNPYGTPFPKKFPVQLDKNPTSMQSTPATGSKILPLIRPNSATRMRPTSPAMAGRGTSSSPFLQTESRGSRPHKFPAAEAAPYMPVRQFSMPFRGMAPPVTIRTAVPVFSAPPPLPTSGHQLPPLMNTPVRMASPVRIRPAVPVFSAPHISPASSPVIPVPLKEQPADVVITLNPPVPVQMRKESSVAVASVDHKAMPVQAKEKASAASALLGHATSVQAKEKAPAASALLGPATSVQVRDPPSVDVALLKPPMVPFQVKEIMPIVASPDLPVIPGQLNELPAVVATSLPVRAAIQIEAVAGSAEKDLQEAAEIERVKQLRI